MARAARHDWEEPCISGSRGSGAVFFSGCNLGCVYCQNREISRSIRGKTLDAAGLRELFARLRDSGVHNLNLVTGTPYADVIAEALEQPPGIPVIWNSGGSAFSSMARANWFRAAKASPFGSWSRFGGLPGME